MKRRFLGFASSLVVLVVGLGSILFLNEKGLVQEAQALNGAARSSDQEISRLRMVSDHFGLNWDVLANGGNTMSSTHFRLSSTVGQPVIGNSSSPHFGLHAGYWQNFLHRVFLPLIFRE